MEVKKTIRNNISRFNLYNKLKQLYYKFLISDEKLLKKRFIRRVGRELNLEKPSLYNDKLQWMKLYWNDSLATQCAYKYEVRNYVSNKIGEQYLNNLIGV